MMNHSMASAPGTPAARRGSIRVVGVGGAGCNVVNHLFRRAFEGVTFAVMSTDARLLARSPVAAQLNLGAKTMRGLGAGGDPERGRLAAEEDAAGIRAMCEGADIVFVVAGLGGGTGTGAAPVVARVAKDAGALVLAMALLPFDCEGARRQRQAQTGLQELKKSADGVICLPNQKVFKLIDEKTGLREALEIANNFVADGVRGIWRMLSRPGLIQLDFDDLCAATRARHTESSLAVAEARGENRMREVVEKLLGHPLIDGGAALAEAAEVLVIIAGGPDLSLAEVNRVMEHLSRQADQARITMGATIEEELGDRLAVTVVASLKPPEGEEAVAGTGRRGPPEWEGELLNTPTPARTHTPFVAPPPELTPQRAEQLLAGQGGGRVRKKAARMLQGQLPLEVVSKGRFEKSEPTIYQGEDLDVPTYIRRGVALN